MTQNISGKKKRNEIEEEQENKIKELISKQKIKGISVDTTAFGRYATELKTGLISNLSQFDKSHPAKFIISEVICDEVTAHLSEALTELRRQVDVGVKAGIKLFGDDNPELSRLGELVASKNADAVAKLEMSEFLIACNATRLKLDESMMPSDIFKRYFSRRPPFQDGKNKSEFPDAAALLSIESWADHYETEVLVVSEDKAWEAFVEGSPRLHLVKKLSTALSLFQKPDDFVEKFVAIFKKEIEDKKSDTYSSIESAVFFEDFSADVIFENVKKDSGYIFEEVYIDEISRLDFEIDNPLKIVEVKEECVHIQTFFFLEAEFSIQVSDQIASSNTRKISHKRIADIKRHASCSLSILIEIPYQRTESDLVIHVEPSSVALDIGDIPSDDWYEDDYE